MFAPFHARSPRDKRAITISIVLAVVIHVVVLGSISIERSKRMRGGAPNVDGLNTTTEAGLPMVKDWNRHRFRVLSELNGKPIERARVTDIFTNEEAYTDSSGIALLMVKPAAKLAAHIEAPGYTMVAGEYANMNKDHEDTIILTPVTIRYASVDSIFVQRCNYCHGAVGKVDSVNLTSYEKTMASTYGGKKVVLPFNPDSSELVQVMLWLRDKNGKLTRHAQQTAPPNEFAMGTIIEWIRQGARHK